MSTEPTRRALLAAGVVGVAGLAGLAGCTGDDSPGSRPTTPRGPDPDAVARQAVVADKRETLRVYDAVIAAHAAVLTVPLAPYVADHVAHLGALGAGPSATPEANPTTTSGAGPSATPTATASPGVTAAPTTPTLPTVPARPDDALALLVARELAGSQRRVEQLGPVSAELARLLGSIGAAEAVHAALLPRVLDEPAA